jgi:hypothetical protein
MKYPGEAGARKKPAKQSSRKSLMNCPFREAKAELGKKNEIGRNWNVTEFQRILRSGRVASARWLSTRLPTVPRFHMPCGTTFLKKPAGIKPHF